MHTGDSDQHASRRRQILTAARAEFAENGLDGTSTARISRRAGVGSGTLLQHFRTKRAIFHAVLAESLSATEVVCSRALAADDPARGLELLIAHMTGRFAHPHTTGLAAAAVLQARRDEDFSALLAENRAMVRHALTAMLADLAAGGAKLQFSAERTARWIQRTIYAAYLTADDERELAELQRVVDWLVGGRVTIPWRETASRG